LDIVKMRFSPLWLVMIWAIASVPLIPVIVMVKANVSKEINWKQLLLLFLCGVIATLIYLMGNVSASICADRKGYSLLVPIVPLLFSITLS